MIAPLLTTAQTAARAGISIGKLMREMRADTFPWPHIRDAQPFWHADEVSRWAAERQPAPAETAQ